MKNNTIEKQRLEDFKAAIRFNLLKCIKECIESGQFKTPHDLYTATARWNKWREHDAEYDKRTYAHIAALNHWGISYTQTAHIFGKVDGKWLDYKRIIAASADITIRTHGTYTRSMDDGQIARHGFCNFYFLPEEEITAIYADSEKMAAYLDLNSYVYTKRQRRLIFGQLLKSEKKTHVKKTHVKKRDDRPTTKADILTEIREMINSKENHTPRNASESKIYPKLQRFIDVGLIGAKEATLMARLYVDMFPPFIEKYKGGIFEDDLTPEQRRLRGIIFAVFHDENIKRDDLSDRDKKAVWAKGEEAKRLLGITK